ncbi:MAG: cyclase family protein [Armatimonadota bacterium]
MRVIDVTGPISTGMWTYGPPYPDVLVEEIEQPDFIEYPTYSWRFELGAQTGTYLETSLHVDRDGPELIEIPVEDLMMRDAAILRVPAEADHRIEPEELAGCGVEVRPGDVVIVATGWDNHWNRPDFVSRCPWFSYDAMRWILDRDPFIMAGDMPRFDSWDDPQGFFGEFFDQGVLLLAPLVNLGEVRAERVKLTALPLKVVESCAAPCRVVITQE